MDFIDGTTEYCCTKCAVLFGDRIGLAECPVCGDSYAKFDTVLIRTGTFAFAYWADANRDVPLLRWTPNAKVKGAAL